MTHPHFIFNWSYSELKLEFLGQGFPLDRSLDLKDFFLILAVPVFPFSDIATLLWIQTVEQNPTPGKDSHEQVSIILVGLV